MFHMGDKVNIQDGAVVHCTYQKTKTLIGNNVSVGHNAIVHGCMVLNLYEFFFFFFFFFYTNMFFVLILNVSLGVESLI